MSKPQRAAKAIADDTAKGVVRSDRAIAKAIGVSAPTVGKARKDATVNNFTVGAPPIGDITEMARVGLDGKQRRMPTRRDEEDDYDPDIAVEQTKQVFL